MEDFGTERMQKTEVEIKGSGIRDSEAGEKKAEKRIEAGNIGTEKTNEVRMKRKWIVVVEGEWRMVLKEN